MLFDSQLDLNSAAVPSPVHAANAKLRLVAALAETRPVPRQPCCAPIEGLPGERFADQWRRDPQASAPHRPTRYAPIADSAIAVSQLGRVRYDSHITEHAFVVGHVLQKN